MDKASLKVLNKSKYTEEINEITEKYSMPLNTLSMIDELGVGEKQRVEIIKVLFRGAKILILDEPTAVLVPQEVNELFNNLKNLKDSGVTIIFISHKLDEVLEIADEISVIGFSILFTPFSIILEMGLSVFLHKAFAASISLASTKF